MDKLSKLHVFIIAQTWIECGMAIGFCYAFEKAHEQVTGVAVLANKILIHYPEITVYKPEVLVAGDWWFPTDEEGLQKRLDILQTEIDKFKSNG